MGDQKAKILYSDLNFVFPVHMNYAKLFLERIVPFKNKIAMIDGMSGENITFDELAVKVKKIAASLTQVGVKKGDIIGICCENRIEVIPTMLAILYSGAITTFFNSSYSKDEIIHIANISKPKFIILSPNAYKNHYRTFNNLKFVKHFYAYGHNNIASSNVKPFRELEENSIDIENYEGANFYGKIQPALILYSSGTTGLPKGVKISHLNYICTAYQAQFTTRPITLLTIAPFTNTMGLVIVTDSVIAGKTVVFLDKFDENVYLETIQKYKVWQLVVAPPIVVTMCKSTILDKYDLSSLQMIVSGGAPLETETINELKTRLPNLSYILQGYGMTEVIGAITKETENVRKLGSVGKIIAGNIVKIVDKENGQILGPRQQGELCVNGPVVFESYIGVDKETDRDGFFKSGDIAYYDEDGFIYIVDRIKELIKYKAWQVPPSEIEALLLQHPSVQDAGVVGIPNKLAGELPAAFIIKKPDSRVTEQDIIEFVASKVSPWKQLRGGVQFVEEIPKNPSGKILRRKLRDSVTRSSKL